MDFKKGVHNEHKKAVLVLERTMPNKIYAMAYNNWQNPAFPIHNRLPLPQFETTGNNNEYIDPCKQSIQHGYACIEPATLVLIVAGRTLTVVVRTMLTAILVLIVAGRTLITVVRTVLTATLFVIAAVRTLITAVRTMLTATLV